MNKPQFNLNYYDPKTIIVMNIPILRKVNINSLDILNDKMSDDIINSNNYINMDNDVSSDNKNVLELISGFYHYVETSFATKDSHGLLSLHINNIDNFTSYINKIIDTITSLNSNIESRFFAQSLRTAQSLKGDLILAMRDNKNESAIVPVSCNIYSTGNNKNSLFCRAKTSEGDVKDVPLLSFKEETRNWVVRYLDDIFYTDTIVLHFPESNGLNVKNSAIYFYFSLMYVLQNMIIDCIKRNSSIEMIGIVGESRVSGVRDVYHVTDDKINDILCVLNEFCSVFQIQLNIKEKSIKHKIDGHIKNDLVNL